jgi:hypothetical protein
MGEKMAIDTTIGTEMADSKTKRLKEEVGSLKDKLAKLQGSDVSGTGAKGQNYQAQPGKEPYNGNIMAQYKQLAQGGEIGAYQMLAHAFTGMYMMMALAYQKVAEAAREVKSLYQMQDMQPAYAGAYAKTPDAGTAQGSYQSKGK